MKTALITGAGTGIGKASALALAQAGYRVICCGRRAAPLETLADEIGDQALPVTLDITDPASVKSLFERLPEDWRAIDLLVNNAGHDIGGRRPFHEGDAEQWAGIIETNVIGLLRLTRAVVPQMIARGSGDIVNLGSIAGITAYAKGAPYNASKFAVHGFSQALRLDYLDAGIRVLEILPGVVRTDFAETRWGDRDVGQAFYDSYDECLIPEDIARTLVFAVTQPRHVSLTQIVVMPSSHP